MSVVGIGEETMTLLKIARLGHPIIRDQAEPVSKEQLQTPEIQNLIDSMIETMRDANGVGIAAPQVHSPKRMIIIEVSPDNPRYPQQGSIPLTVIVNPIIVSQSDNYEQGWEGCLSVPDLRGKVPRSTHLKVSGLDRDGNPLQFEAEGFFARVIQHEVDHLEGKVYLDRLPDMSTLTFLREYEKYWKPNQ